MRAVPPLIEALKDSEWKVRRAAAEALGHFTAAGNKSIQPLLDCLRDDRVEVRRVAILSLGRLDKGSPQVRDSIGKFTEDPDPVTKMNAHVALSIIGKSDDSAIPTLIAALGSQEDTTARAAGLSLSRLGQELPEKLLPALTVAANSHEEPLATNALKVFREMKGSFGEILPHLRDLYNKVDSKKKRLVLQTVVEMDAKGEQALPLCIKGLTDADSLTRKEALMGALRYRSRLDAFIKPLVEALKDQNEENQLLAIGIIRGLGDKGASAVPTLISLVKEGTPRTRVSALTCLGVLTPSSEDSVRALETALGDTDERVKIAALSTLRTVGQRDPGTVIPILERALNAEKEQTIKRSIVATLDGLKKTGQAARSR